MNQTTARNPRSRLTWVEWLVILAAGAAVLAFLVPALQAMLYKADARAALANAKAARLACYVVSSEQYAAAEPFADHTQPDGMVEGMQEKILLLSKVPGTLHLLQTSPDGYNAVRLAYTEYEFLVLYDASNGTWLVYRSQNLISASGS